MVAIECHPKDGGPISLFRPGCQGGTMLSCRRLEALKIALLQLPEYDKEVKGSLQVGCDPRSGRLFESFRYGHSAKLVKNMYVELDPMLRQRLSPLDRLGPQGYVRITCRLREGVSLPNLARAIP